MYALEKISTGTTREAGHQPDGTEYPAWSGQDGKNYGSERGCNSFLNVSFVPIAPQSVTREDHDGISHNLITQENYEFLRDSYFRYAGLLNVDAPHDRGKSIGEGIANLYNEFAALLDETVPYVGKVYPVLFPGQIRGSPESEIETHRVVLPASPDECERFFHHKRRGGYELGV